MVQINQKLDFTGECIYAGIDVHKKQWSVCIMSSQKEHKTFVQPPEPAVLSRYLRENFPGATYFSVYEAGFCGFWIDEDLKKEGIHNIVVNPADVPTTDKEKRQKRDRVDSRKLCKRLRDQDLQAIYVPNRCQLEDRHMIRLRKKLVQDITRCKNRIKGLLNYYGIKVDDTYNTSHWSKAFVKWLSELDLRYSTGTTSLRILVEELKSIEQLKKSISRQLVVLSKQERFIKPVKLLRSIPGVGLIGALTLSTELGDINRFRNLDQLCSYIGLVPNVYSSGDTEHIGHLTQRKNAYVQPILIQCAWRAVGQDPALLRAYEHLRKRMMGQQAIIRIARKLLSRIRYVLVHQKEYQLRIS
jgi:transposase